MKLRFRALALATALAAVQVVPATNAMAEDFSRDQIEGIIHDYLMKNPEVIRDAVQELQKREEAKAEQARQDAISGDASPLFNSPHQVVLGNPKGDVTLVEFFDYNCGYCKRALGDMQKLLKTDTKLRVVLKEFPVLGPGSVEAAQVAIAVRQLAPEKYEEFHDKLLGQHGQANKASATKVALSLGLDKDALEKAEKAPEVETTLHEVYGLADSLNLTGTPSYVIANDVVVGAVGYDQLESMISSVRKCGKTSC